MSRPTVLLALLAACSPEPAPTAVEPAATAVAPPPAVPVAPALEEAPPESARLPVDAVAMDRAQATAALDAPLQRLAVTLDRPLYRPGETVWARVWDLAAGPLDGRPTEAGAVVGVELVDPRGAAIASARYLREAAGASVALDLPPGLAGGLYTLRARAGAGVVDRPLLVAGFEEPRIRKELELLRDAYGPGDEVVAALTVASSGRGPLVDHPITVLVQVEGLALPAIAARTDTRGEATLRFRLPDAMHRPDALVTVVVEEEGWTESITRDIPVVLDAVRLELFSEGGAAVSGLPSRVYVRARDRDGQPADVAGVVEDGDGREVGRFRTVHDGLGRFELTPEPGKRYSVRPTEPAAGEVLPLGVASEGCVLRSYDDLDGERPELRVGVWCSEEQAVVVTGQLRGHAFVPARVRAGPGAPTVVHLRAEDRAAELSQGVARVTVWSDELEPLAERLVYRNRARSLQITVAPERTRHGPRDEVVLKVTTRDPSGEPVRADVALSVADDRLLKYADDQHGDLRSQLHLAPWITGAVEDPGWYFDPEQADAGRGLDLVLGTFGWRRFAERSDANQPPPPAGVMGALDDDELHAVLGAAAAPTGSADFWGQGAPLGAGGLGGLLGAEGAQLGAGGLGGRGTGLGGGGIGEGLGGLGIRGMGSGASGYGMGGGGSFGAKGEGGLGAPGGDPIILGDLPRDAIDAVVKRHMNQLRYCYQRELQKRPVLQGKVVVKFTIAKDGTVSAAQTKSTTLGDANVERCIVGRFLRLQFPEPRRGGIVIVSYPLVFSPGGAVGSAPLTPVRVFPQPDYALQPPPAVRSDFRSTVAWFPSVDTGADGTATVRFFLADTVTTWQITAEGVGGGHVGHQELELHSTLPFSLDVPLPQEVSFGDRLLMPVRLSNRRDAPLSVDLVTTVGAPLSAEDGTGTQRLSLAAGTGGLTLVPIGVPDVIGSAEIVVAASADQLTDSVKRTLTVAPRGFPHRWAAGGQLGDTATHTVVIEDALSGGTEAALTLYPSPLSTLFEGLASMVRMPNGCFEQTSSTNHPNVLVLEYLGRTGGSTGLLVDGTEALRAGYAKLAGYQVDGGGFETFGQGPGKEALSAYGLLQFTRMRRVYPEVDRAMTDRDVAFLLAARDGAGGYRVSGASSHAYGAAPAKINDAYVTYALAETGHLIGGPEIDRQRAQARTTSDPYPLALATLAIRHEWPQEAAAAAARLAGLQAPDGSFPGAATSVSASGGQDLLVETTALAALALHRAGGGDVPGALRWLAEARHGSMGWGGTQATVLALEAIATASADDAPRPGQVVVRVDGARVATVAYTGAERDGVKVDLSGRMSPGEHTIELVHQGKHPIPYALEATWRRDTPADAATAPLSIDTTLAAEEVALGGTVRLVATIENTSGAGVASPIARIGLPAGMRVEPRQLEDLRDRDRIAFFETRPREVTLYWEGLGPGERQDVALELVAEVPGTFTAPPSVVYPYYTTDGKRWADGPTVRIRP